MINSYFRRMRYSGVLVILLLAMACSKDTPAPSFTSADGVWTYKTPDGSISVDFELKTTGGVLGIVNPASITVSGTQGVAAAVMNGVALPAIGEIRINANDAGLVLPYAITFTTCSVNSTFTQITAADVSYNYPFGTTKTLSNITLLRK